jgi:hypothetical protein
MSAIRLLVSARDVAAALHLAEVVRVARGDPRFEVHVVAQEPALGHFVAAGLDVHPVKPCAAQALESEEALELLQIAQRILDGVRPDVALVGLSTPFDAGIDEAILAEAQVPTLLFQDFWGEQNLILGHGADEVLSIDAEAARCNTIRFGTPGVVVGSPRHVAYRTIDLRGQRAHLREKAGAGDRPVYGFFGQALHRLPGYARTIEAFIEAVGSVRPEPFIFVRPHPRETAADRARTAAMFSDLRFPTYLEEGGPVETMLAACDVVCSLFSMCTYDTAYLNRFSSAPVAVPVSMLFDEEITRYMRAHVNFETFPYHTAGIVRAVHEKAQLAPTLQSAIEEFVRRAVWKAANEFLPDPTDAPQRILDRVAHAAARRA